MHYASRRPLVVSGVLASCGLLLFLVHRVFEIRAATRETTEFCSSVSKGDSIAAVLERAQSGASRLVAVVEHQALPSGSFRQLGGGREQFTVIFEDRKGASTWPRYLIWKGPHYRRVYCSLEPTPEGRVKAIHLGPVDEETGGFFEDWLSG
jgi:hypothetical protein